MLQYRLQVSVLSMVGLVGCATATTAPPPTPATARVDTVYMVDTVAAATEPVGVAGTAGRFDNGKMWTFEFPPMAYFKDEYGFSPDAGWFEHARLSALRLPNCTASFVSSRGLVLTNHHCARESVSQVSTPDEQLLDDGFYAPTLADERAVEDLYVDQLIAIVDVSQEMDVAPEAEREQLEEDIGRRIATQYSAEDSVVVEVISLWNGAKTSAYVFRRFTDVRLVMAPELQLGYFGGDPDNFTYPRYSLDMSFLRVYRNDEPYTPQFYFPWSEAGAVEGDAVFVIGNPGSTTRLQTVAQLEFRRAVEDRATLDFITSRIQVLQSFADGFPEEAAELDLRNSIFSLLNSQKAYRGIWAGLHDPVIIARRRDTERKFETAIQSDPTLAAQYGGLVERLAQIQEEKGELAPEIGAFFGLGNPDFTAAVLLRSLSAFQYLAAKGGGAPAETVSELGEALREVGDQPRALQQQLLAARLRDFVQYLGADDGMVRRILRGLTPEQAAEDVVAQSVLTDSAAAVAAMEGGSLAMTDPGVQVIAAMVQRVVGFQERFVDLQEREDVITRQLGRARFEIYGIADPPDATFSLRIADGLVSPYEYNGTRAPVHTTFHGLYDRHYSFGGGDWALPDRWKNPPESFDLSTPLNFVSTADIIGGNSGSPVINPRLELVGVAFDGNIESLPGDYIYLSEKNRAVAVDVRGMIEALENIYQANRIVAELRAGRSGG